MKQCEERIPIFNVVRTADDRWQVVSDELGEPVAFFNTTEEACSWAIVRAKPRRGRVFVENTPVDMEMKKDGYFGTPWQKPPTRFSRY